MFNIDYKYLLNVCSFIMNITNTGTAWGPKLLKICAPVWPFVFVKTMPYLEIYSLLNLKLSCSLRFKISISDLFPFKTCTHTPLCISVFVFFLIFTTFYSLSIHNLFSSEGNIFSQSEILHSVKKLCREHIAQQGEYLHLLLTAQ